MPMKSRASTVSPAQTRAAAGSYKRPTPTGITSHAVCVGSGWRWTTPSAAEMGALRHEHIQASASPPPSRDGDHPGQPHTLRFRRAVTIHGDLLQPAGGKLGGKQLESAEQPMAGGPILQIH